jgi:hypothetical protein
MQYVPLKHCYLSTSLHGIRILIHPWLLSSDISLLLEIYVSVCVCVFIYHLILITYNKINLNLNIIATIQQISEIK